jgi:transcriptional antiterminator RfaH
MKYWLVATYKINDIKRAESNLSNQNFEYYLPKIKVKKSNSNFKEEILFPGYVFIKTRPEDYSLIKYTKGIKKIVKFGKNIPHLSDNEINSVKSIEKISNSKPITSKINIGQESEVTDGPFKGTIVKICSLPSKDRIEVLLSILGSSRRVSILEKDLVF